MPGNATRSTKHSETPDVTRGTFFLSKTRFSVYLGREAPIEAFARKTLKTMSSFDLTHGNRHGILRRIRVKLRSWTWRRWTAVGTLFFLGWLSLTFAEWYYEKLTFHGHTGPFALMYTSPYAPPKGTEGQIPPEGYWRPSNLPRVVVSLSTMPASINFLRPTLYSLLAQTLAPDAIYLNVPIGKNKRTGLEYVIPAWITEMEKITPLKVLRTKVDYGPATKLVSVASLSPSPPQIPALEVETDNSTIIITVDDDKIYPPHLISSMAWFSHRDPEVAFSPCGWGFLHVWGSNEVLSAYVPALMRGEGRFVDVLQGVCGNTFRRKFFAELEELKSPPAACFTMDDVWFAGFLAHHKVRRAVIPNKSMWRIADWENPLESYRNPVPKTKGLSVHNHSKKDMYAACVKSVEELYGGAWETAAKY